MLTITWHLDATGTRTIGTETPFMNYSTHPFTPQPTPTDSVCVDRQPKAKGGPEMGSQNGGDACYTSTSGVPAKTSPIGKVWPINTSLNVGAVASNGESPDTSLNAERIIDVEMDEEQMVDIANEDSEPGIVIDTSRGRGPILPTKFQGDVAKLKVWLLAKGANAQVVELCDTVFKNGVTIEALEERMTREQCEGLGVRDGKQFRLFLELVVGTNGTGQHRCRLCSPGKVYKNHRDALRHLLKDHFGLSFTCERW